MTFSFPVTLTWTSRFAAVVLGLLIIAAGCSASPEAAEPTTPPVGEDQPAAETGDVRLLAIGDSVLAWNDDGSTPAMVGAELQQRGVAATIDNRSVSGSCLLVCGGDETIPSTYIDGDWTHVLISGGGNDMGEPCRSPDALLSPDLDHGTMAELIDRIPTTTTVLLYHYSTAEPYESAGICPEIRELMQRYRSLADARSNVTLVDATLVSGPNTPELWDDDVHPSVEGSRIIGQLIADLIQQPIG